jgi:multiple sugar transport system substrate-binding protein
MMRQRQLRTLLAGAMALAVVAGGGVGASAQDEPISLNMIGMAQAGMTPDEMNAVIAEFTALNPNITVVPDYVAYDALHDKIATGMAAGQSPFDIMLVDDIWFPEFAEAGWVKDISADIPAEMLADSDPAAWDIVSYDGKQYGLPWLLDQLYFYYNEDMLTQAGFDAPPTTYEEMMAMAQVMKDKGIVESPIVLAWAQAEAAITEFVAFLYANNGAFFDDAGVPVFNSPEAVAVLQWMVDGVKSGLVNPASTTYVEEDVRNTMQAGKAAFGINWAYMLDLANDPANSPQAGKIRMGLLPAFEQAKAAGTVSSSNNGSMGFAVSAGSEHADAALAFIEYLTSKDVQKRYAAHVTPLWKSLYSDPDLLAAQPVLLDMFAKQWPYAHVRPKVPYYIEMSQSLQVAIQEALTGAKTPQQALDEAVAAAVELAAQQ